MLGLGFKCNLFVFSQGAVQGPEEFAEGFVIGVRSLFGHTVGRKPDRHWTFASFSAFNVHASHKSVVNPTNFDVDGLGLNPGMDKSSNQ